MTETSQEVATQDVGPKGLFLVGGSITEVITSSEASAVRNHLGSLLQVKNLVVLFGSGASFHLRSPQTRNLTNDQVIDLIRKSGGSPCETDAVLLATINPADSGDLEQLLNGLQLATSLAA